MDPTPCSRPLSAPASIGKSIEKDEGTLGTSGVDLHKKGPSCREQIRHALMFVSIPVRAGLPLPKLCVLGDFIFVSQKRQRHCCRLAGRVLANTETFGSMCCVVLRWPRLAPLFG